MIYSLSKPVSLHQLADELAAAHGWPAPPGLTVVEQGDTRTLRIDRDGADDVKVEKVLTAHIPAAPVDRTAEFRKAVTAATTLDGLKAALLGTAGPGAEARRPTGA